MADNKGFLDQIGVGSQDETALLRAQLEQQAARGNSRGASMRRLGQQGSGLVHGIAGGIGGLINGEGGRGVKEFGRDFTRSMTGREDQMAADAAGITLKQLETRRQMRTAASQIPQDGSFESRIALAKRMAEIASRGGDANAHANALRMITELEKEQQEFKKLEGTVADAEDARRISKATGFEARHVNDDDNVRGKAVEILEGPDAGKFRLIRPGVEDEVVTGGELIAPGLTGKATKAPSTRKFETLQGIASDQGASGGRIATLRSEMGNMRENATIVSNMATNLIAAADPQGAVGLQGKAALKADNAIRFVESASTVLAGKTGTNDLTYGDKRVSAQKQYELATKPTIFERFLHSQGVVDIQAALPPGIEANSAPAAAWVANLMQLAYVDARMMEPSNRGLSDKDIEAALARMGAASGNPVNFAKRQLEMIESQLLPRLHNLGSDFTAPPEGPSNPHGYTAQDVSGYVYDPAQREKTVDALLTTAEKLREVIDQGPRGKNRAEPDPDNPHADMSNEALDARIEELRRLKELEDNG